MGLYYQEVAQAFDRAAAEYDELYRANRIMDWMRGESLTALQAAFPPGSRLLEIGCGTGDEALALSRLGYRVVATDISAAMIEAAQAKASDMPPGQAVRVTWRTLPAGRLAELSEEFGTDAFDGAYSSFGSLNCEPDLGPVAASLANLLRPGARLVCSVMNRWCFWEIGWYMLHLRPRQALRRLPALPALRPEGGCPGRTFRPPSWAVTDSSPRPLRCATGFHSEAGLCPRSVPNAARQERAASAGGKGWVRAGLAAPGGTLVVPVRYYTPREFAEACTPYFRLRSVRGLPVLLPPPYLEPLARRHPGVFARLEAAEARMRDRWLFRALGDHFLLVLERVDRIP